MQLAPAFAANLETLKETSLVKAGSYYNGILPDVRDDIGEREER